MGPSGYPNGPAERTRFVRDRRPAKPRHDPWAHQGVALEDERAADGCIARSATVFVTGRECPWHCVMCDLWRFTIDEDTPVGAIPQQLADALATIGASGEGVVQVKLYNASSFFDPRAIPTQDWTPIASTLAVSPTIHRVVVESHPGLVGDRVTAFRDVLQEHGPPGARLEVALGLETAHPSALGRLHKGMTVADFEAAAAWLTGHDIDVRAFLLLPPPFVPVNEQETWLQRSIDVAIESGASVVSLIPTRARNGALDELIRQGLAREPTLADMERSLARALAEHRVNGRIFVDLWDLDRFATCQVCREARRTRLRAMNLSQADQPAVSCEACGGSASCRGGL